MQPRGGDALADEPAGRFPRVPARASRSADHRVAVKRGPAPQHASRRRWRVAFDEQVLAQAPEDAVGYRVALPGRDEWDAPRVVPDADEMGSPSFWRLRPFELPDDIRLRSGRLYRLLWVDAQGARVPPTGCRFLPALRFFLGPPDEVRGVRSVGRSSGRAAAKKRQPTLDHNDLTERRAAIEDLGDSLRGEPGEHEHVAGSMEEQTGSLDLQPQAAETVALMDGASDAPMLEQSDGIGTAVPAQETRTLGTDSSMARAEVLAQSSVAEDAQSARTAPDEQRSEDASSIATDVDVAVAALVPQLEIQAPAAESVTTTTDVPTRPTVADAQQALSAGLLDNSRDDTSSSHPKVTVQLGPKTLEVAEAAWEAVQAQLTAARDGASCIPVCSPPLTDAELKELTGIILHTEKCAAFMHELDCFHARVVGKPSPSPPDLALQPDERERIQSLACDPRLNRAAIDLRGAWIGLHMQGPDAMFRLPPPFVSLTEVDAGRITSILNSPAKRAYAVYAADRVEALQTGRPLPPQPASDLAPKVRRQIHQLFSDARLLTLMTHGLWTREAEAARKSEVGESDGAGHTPTAS